MKNIIILITFLILSCSNNSERLFKETRTAMYTITSITIYSKDEDSAKKIIDDVFKELQRLEKLLNYYSKDSEIALINQYAGIKPVKVSKETIEIIEKSCKAAEITEGGFDITLGPVISLWDFKSKKIPSEEALKKAISHVDYKKIVIDKGQQTVYLAKKGMEINLGGIIKGYAADKSVNLLKERGIKGGIVSIGGDIKVFGLKTDLSMWNVGIQNPRVTKKEDELLGTVYLKDKCISTSGDYEKYFIFNDKRYHHIINPKTGMPAEGIRSITIVTDEGAFCDALATGLFVMGSKRAMEKMSEFGIDGMIVTEQGEILMTPFFKENFKKI
ncbi:MAG: FAD:protein FMN transferase [Thermodesulfovibrionales bacterium]|nr:FAD:protein FMN transferase [Thermodesulfovibrionales bacterium]